MSLNQLERPLNLTFMLKIHLGMLTELRPLFASVSLFRQELKHMSCST